MMDASNPESAMNAIVISALMLLVGLVLYSFNGWFLFSIGLTMGGAIWLLIAIIQYATRKPSAT